MWHAYIYNSQRVNTLQWTSSPETMELYLLVLKIKLIKKDTLHFSVPLSLIEVCVINGEKCETTQLMLTYLSAEIGPE